MPTPACTCVSLHDHGAGRCVQVSKKRGKSAGIVERLLVLLRENQEQLQRYHALRTAMAQPPQLPDELLALDNSEDSGDDDDGGGDGVSIGGEEAERQPQREEREGESEEEKEEEGETGEEEKENEEEEGGTVERCDSADASGRSDVQDPKPRVCSEREEARAARERVQRQWDCAASRTAARPAPPTSPQHRRRRPPTDPGERETSFSRTNRSQRSKPPRWWATGVPCRTTTPTGLPRR